MDRDKHLARLEAEVNHRSDCFYAAMPGDAPCNCGAFVVLLPEHLTALQNGEILRFGNTAISYVIPASYATGAEIRKFWENGWDGDYYHDSDCAGIQIQDDEGKWILNDADSYDLSELGDVRYQGFSRPASKPESLTFEDAFLKWKSTVKE